MHESLPHRAVDASADFVVEPGAVVRRSAILDDGEDEGVVFGEAQGETGPVEGRVSASTPGFMGGGAAVGAAEEGLLADGEAVGGICGGVFGREGGEDGGGDWIAADGTEGGGFVVGDGGRKVGVRGRGGQDGG